MKLYIALAGITVGFLLGGGSVSAHHSFAAEFDANQPITLTGTLAKIEFVNPHGWIYVDVTGPDGKVTQWAVETGAPNSLMRRGLRVTDFHVGSAIVVEGYRAKDGKPTANGVTVKFSDGRNFFMGSSGNGAPEPKNGGQNPQ